MKKIMDLRCRDGILLCLSFFRGGFEICRDCSPIFGMQGCGRCDE